jgi:hypothetical protein
MVDPKTKPPPSEGGEDRREGQAVVGAKIRGINGETLHIMQRLRTKQGDLTLKSA